jgi:hypothetical protein
MTSGLDGTWTVRRTGGLLPPMVGVRKVIAGERGATYVGPLPAAPFEVDGLALRYRAPFSGFVDLLQRDGDGFSGRAMFSGRELGRFELRPTDAARFGRGARGSEAFHERKG